jgi:hypothetical protein
VAVSPDRIFLSILFSDLLETVFHSHETTTLCCKVNVVPLTSRFHPWSKSDPYPLYRRLDEPQSKSGHCEVERNPSEV